MSTWALLLVIGINDKKPVQIAEFATAAECKKSETLVWNQSERASKVWGLGADMMILSGKCIEISES